MKKFRDIFFAFQGKVNVLVSFTVQADNIFNDLDKIARLFLDLRTRIQPSIST